MNPFKIIFSFLIIVISVLEIRAQQDTLILLPPPADTNTSRIKFEANLDVYYYYSNLKQDSYTFMVLKHNQPDLGFINASLSYDSKKVGSLINLAAGPRTNEFYDNDDLEFLKYLRQLYFYYRPIEALTLNIGWKTSWFGYEYADPHQNPNYSMSFLNSATAANYGGIWSDYALNDKFTFSAGVFNDTDRRVDDVPGVHLGGLLAYVGDSFEASLAYINGKEQPGRLSTIDFLATYTVSESNSIALELHRSGYNKSTTDDVYFNAMNVYLMHNFSESASLNFRFEYFNDSDGYYFDTRNNNVIDFTLTGKWQWKWFVFMPELRYDMASEAVFLDADGGAVKSGFGGVLGVSVVY